MKKKIIIICAVVFTLIGARFAYSLWGQMMQQKMMKANAMPQVSVSEVEETQVLKQIEAPGRVMSKHRVDVVARIDGYLTKSYFKEGDLVKKGQILFEIEPQQYLFQVQQGKANVDNTRAQLIYAEKQLKRAEILVKKDYIAKAQFDEMTANRDALKGQLAMYQAQLRDAQRNYGYTKVKAPVDGQIGIISVTVGNFVNQAVGALTTINSTNPIYVTFPIDSKEYMHLTEIDSVETKRKVKVVFPNGEEYNLTGLQDFHDNNIDPTTGTITMRATFPNPNGKLINGEYVKATVYSNNTIGAPIVPQTAVMENAQGKYVYRLDEKNIPRIAILKTNGQYKQNWIIEDGIKKGDKIVTGGIQKVIPDTPVKIITEEEFKQTKSKVKK